MGQHAKAGIDGENAASGKVTIKTCSFEELTASELETWEQIRSTRSEFATPFFSARFSHAVQLSRGDVEVAVIYDGSGIIGFFPFHRIKNIAYPVGRCFNDAHNIIATKENARRIDWLWLLDQLKVRAFDFHALLGADLEELGEKNYIGTIQSFCSDLGDDSQAFLKRLGKRHKTIGRQPQKTRKMEREIGKVELEFDCRDPEILAQTIEWKRNQYRRTDILDLFTPDWTRALLTELHVGEGWIGDTDQTVPGNMRGLLSVLRADGKIVAAHYGMVEDDLLHYWFPTYDTNYGRYSPGTALFMAITSAATDHGIRCIDMGYGEQPYKLKQTDTTSSVAYGCLSRSGAYRQWRSLETKAIATIKKAPMKETLKRIWRKVRPDAGISKLR